MRTFKEFIEISEKWSQKYKNSIDCNNPKGFSQRAHCDGRKKVDEALDGKTPIDPNYSLRDWFKGWVQTGGRYDGKPCAKQPGQTTKPYCRDADVRAAMDPEEREKRAKKKRKEDPNPTRSGSAKIVTQEEAGEKDACYKKVKSRYRIWPSAYASGALVKCRKVGASNWGNKSKKK